MSFSTLLKNHGFSKEEISYLSKKVKKQAKVDPFATQAQRERTVVQEYLADMQTEKDNILTQIKEVSK